MPRVRPQAIESALNFAVALRERTQQIPPTFCQRRGLRARRLDALRRRLLDLRNQRRPIALSLLDDLNWRAAPKFVKLFAGLFRVVLLGPIPICRVS
jgi:hypothetical protein